MAKRITNTPLRRLTTFPDVPDDGSIWIEARLSYGGPRTKWTRTSLSITRDELRKLAEHYFPELRATPPKPVAKRTR